MVSAITSATAIPERIVDALTSATARTGEGFDYLLKTAMRESALDPAAAAPTSSARGLFQFVEQTWLGTVKQAGPEHGLAAYADQITQNATGRYVVSDPGTREEVLALRNNPDVAAIMAGELTASNRAELTDRLGREPTDGELYIAHFLGASGAGKLIATASRTPAQRADQMFPSAARANRSIFYAADGSARSVNAVYHALVSRHQVAGAGPAAVAAVPETAAQRPAQPETAATPWDGVANFFETLFNGLADLFGGRPGREAPVGRQRPASGVLGFASTASLAGSSLTGEVGPGDRSPASRSLWTNQVYGARTPPVENASATLPPVRSAWLHGLFLTGQTSTQPFDNRPPAG